MSPPDNAIAALSSAWHLEVLGGFRPNADDPVPEGTQAVLLLGPQQPGFWPAFIASPEYTDGGPDPLDRWSRRAVGHIAEEYGATALFPFGGPPWMPFIGWAQRTGRVWSSPAGLLVHASQGLWVSFRGALALSERIDLPPRATSPCDSCAEQPCLSACPVTALTADGYNVARCHDGLDAGLDCMSRGCAARAACPVSQKHPRPLDQSAFHMQAFHP